MRSMFCGVSGLKNHQIRMDVLGNNIANVNTTGFKSSRVTFQDMLSQTLRGGTAPTTGGLGGINPAQVGLGMLVGSIDTLHTQGNLGSTGKSTDMAVQGNGFFVVGTDDVDRYTRDGGFDIGSDGYLVNPSNGYRVKGWLPDVTTGDITVSQNVVPILLPIGQTEIAQATSDVNLAGNLDATGTVATSGSVALSDVMYSDVAHTTAALSTTLASSLYNSAGNRLLASGDTITLSSKKGGESLAANTLTVSATTTLGDIASFINTYAGIASGETYTYSGASVTSGVDVSGGALRIKGNMGEGNALTTITMTQDNASAGGYAANFLAVADNLLTNAQEADGTSCNSQMNVYDSQGTTHAIKVIYTKTGVNTWSWTADCADDINGRTVTNDGVMKSLTFSSTGAYSTSTGTIAVDLTGPSDIAITPSMSRLTQFDGTSSVNLTDQNGYPKGTLDKFTIGSDGLITGIYTNGLTKTLAQIALATFNNPSGLLKEGNNVFAESTNSSTAQKGSAGTGGRGTINNGVLEMSNVDLAQTFTDMIITQRGFQANAKIITTSDDMLLELVNLKR